MTANKNGDDFDLIKKQIEKIFEEHKDKLINPHPVGYQPLNFIPMEGLKPGELYAVSTPIHIGKIPKVNMSFNINIHFDIPKRCHECGCEYYKAHPDSECQYGLVQQVIDE